MTADPKPRQYILTEDEAWIAQTATADAMLDELDGRLEAEAEPGPWLVEVRRPDGTLVATFGGDKPAPKKMGRPKMPKGVAKTERVQLKLRPAEKARWSQKAEAAGMTLQAWVERQCGAPGWKR